MRFLQRALMLGGVVSVTVAGWLAATPLPAQGPFVEPEAEAIHEFTGEQSGDSFGWVSENLGDIDGDGVSDFIISAPFFSDDGTPQGKAYVYSGAGGSLLNTVAGGTYDELGFWASSAGDVNADGVPDYIIGARGSLDAPQRFKGRVLVFSGDDHSLLHELTIDGISGFGYDVAGVGDLNDDGYDDFVVGAPFVTGTFFRQGQVYVYSGYDGAELWHRDGADVDDFMGTAVGGIDDLNGDGVPDVLVGAMGAGRALGRTTNGAAWVLSGATGETLMRLDAFAAGTAERFGQFFASSAGDVNDDGTPDIFIPDYDDWRGGGIGGRTTAGQLGTGRAYVFSGVDGSYLHVINGENRGWSDMAVFLRRNPSPGKGTGDANTSECLSSWFRARGRPVCCGLSRSRP